jgi:amidase
VDHLLRASAVAQAEAIRGGLVSSEELVQAHLDRIAAVNPTLNAVVQLDADGALDSARAADRRLAGGEPAGPFHGVPFTVKDWIETAGLVCAAGLIERKGYVPKRDATAVARMRAAGAILLGKTNVQESNDVYGATRNPYDVARSPGASSSGEVAIIAAGGSPLGLGSNSGGAFATRHIAAGWRLSNQQVAGCRIRVTSPGSAHRTIRER